VAKKANTMNSLPATAKREVSTTEALDTVLKALRGAIVPRDDIREALRQLPDLADRGGDWAEQAEASVAAMAAGGSPVIEESTRVSLEATRKRLGQPGDGELERLLVRRVALTSLALDMAERKRASKWGEGLSADEADFWDRHVSRLQGDFLRACRGLAVVRKLRRPTLVAQVNIAEQQQVNVLK
jgi:hypothetical protein